MSGDRSRRPDLPCYDKLFHNTAGLPFDDCGVIPRCELSEVGRKGGVAELRVPLEHLGAELGQGIALFVVLARDRRIVETLPTIGDDPERLTFQLGPLAQ